MHGTPVARVQCCSKEHGVHVARTQYRLRISSTPPQTVRTNVLTGCNSNSAQCQPTQIFKAD
eukprot:2121070-Karenia_brevis.AAC.1